MASIKPKPESTDIDQPGEDATMGGWHLGKGPSPYPSRMPQHHPHER